MKTTIRKTDILLLLAGVAGFGYFAVTYDRLYPDSVAGTMISRAEAIRLADGLLRSAEMTRPETWPDMRREEEIEQDETLIQYLQERYGLESTVRMLPDLEIFTWKVAWYGKETGNIRIGAGNNDDNGEPSEGRTYVEVHLDGQGHVVRLRSGPDHKKETTSPSDEGQSVALRAESISVDSARRMALAFVRSYTGHDIARFSETDVHSARDNRGQMFNFTFTSSHKTYDLDHTLHVGIQNDRVRSFESTWKTPPDFVPHKDRWLGESQSIVSLIMIILFSVITVVYFLFRFRSGAFDYRLGIFFGLVTAMAFSGMMAMIIWNSSWLGLTVVIIFGGGWWALSSGAIVVVSASLAREVWPKKYQTFEAIRRGRVFNRPFGMGVLRGILWSFLALGLINGVLPWLPGTSFVMDNQSQAKFGHQGAWFLIFAGLFSALIHFHAYVLLSLSALGRQWKSLAGLVVLGLLINMVSLPFMGPVAPWSSRLILGLVIAGIAVLIFLKYDFLTVFTFGVVTFVLQEGFVFIAMHDTTQITVITTFLVLIAGLGVAGLISRQSGDDVLEYVPEYIRELENKERMKREFEIARQIQTTFLCCKIPSSQRYELATMCDPAYEVGGDYYDFIRFGDDDRRLGVIIGDVSGKGVSAAFYMTLIKGIMQTQATITTHSTRETLVRANDLFYEHVERGKFISMIYAILDFENGTLRMSRAGHNPVLVKPSAKQQAEPLLPNGIAIGLTHGKGFADALQEVEISFRPGDVFVFYTDGFSEAMNHRGEEFGEERLYDVIQKYAHEAPQHIVDHVRSEVARFVGQTPQHDDMTMIAVKVT